MSSGVSVIGSTTLASSSFLSLAVLRNPRENACVDVFVCLMIFFNLLHETPGLLRIEMNLVDAEGIH